MNSKPKQNVDTILDVVFELLDERHLYELIEEPIDKVVADFTFDTNIPMTHDYFIETTSRFVRHIYQQGLFIRQKLSISQARTETTALLEIIFKITNKATEYETAFLYALNDIGNVLAQISDHIKWVSRVKYKRWIYINYIDSLDWAVKCQIVGTLTKRSTCLPPDITNCAPVRFVDNIPDLIDIIISAENPAYHLISAGFPADSA